MNPASPSPRFHPWLPPAVCILLIVGFEFMPDVEPDRRMIQTLLVILLPMLMPSSREDGREEHSESSSRSGALAGSSSSPSTPARPASGRTSGATFLLRESLVAIRMLAAMTLLAGVAYPLLVTGVAWTCFRDKARGSMIVRDGETIGSRLIAAPEDDAPGGARGRFRGRPSATSPPRNAAASSGSNLGPLSPALEEAVRARIETLRADDPDNTAPIPVDLVTASASGLDPHVSPAAALWQVARVARDRGLSEDAVRALVERHVEPRALGLLGEPVVNVLELNLALDELALEADDADAAEASDADLRTTADSVPHALVAEQQRGQEHVRLEATGDRIQILKGGFRLFDEQERLGLGEAGGRVVVGLVPRLLEQREGIRDASQLGRGRSPDRESVGNGGGPGPKSLGHPLHLGVLEGSPVHRESKVLPLLPLAREPQPGLVDELVKERVVGRGHRTAQIHLSGSPANARIGQAPRESQQRIGQVQLRLPAARRDSSSSRASASSSSLRSRTIRLSRSARASSSSCRFRSARYSCSETS